MNSSELSTHTCKVHENNIIHGLNFAATEIYSNYSWTDWFDWRKPPQQEKD